MQEVPKHGVEQKCLLKAREYLLELRICLHNHVADIIIIGWVCRYHRVNNLINRNCSIALLYMPGWAIKVFYRLRRQIYCRINTSCSMSKKIGFCEIPKH